MDSRASGNDGLVLWSPYPKLGLTGTFTSPYGKGWSARMAGHNRTLSTTLPQRPTRPWGLTPPSPYPKPGLGKAVLAGVTDRETGQVGARVVKGTDAVTLKGFLRYHAKPGTTVYTDEAPGYQGMTDMDHHTVNHGGGEYAVYRGLSRYVNEFCGRHNIRGLDTVEMMLNMVAGMVGKRLTYMELTGM